MGLNVVTSQPVVSRILTPQQNSVHESERLDVLIRHLDKDYGVDVSVTHPNSFAAMGRFLQSVKILEESQHKSSIVEKAKFSKYKKLIEEAKGKLVFMPFVCETYGALSENAHFIISLISSKSDNPRIFKQKFTNDISITLQRCNADIQRRGSFLVRKASSILSEVSSMAQNLSLRTNFESIERPDIGSNNYARGLVGSLDTIRQGIIPLSSRCLF